MRWIVLMLLVTSLAGCTQGDERPPEDFDPTCPQWSISKNSHRANLVWVYNETLADKVTLEKTDDAGKGLEYNGSRPLDRFTITFEAFSDESSANVAVLNGTLTLEAFTGDTNRPLTFLRGAQELGRKLTWESGQHTVDPVQIQITKTGEPPAPQYLHLVWNFTPDRTTGDDHSGAVVEYVVNFWYLNEKCF